MFIKKVLNNNAVVCISNAGEEVIVRGRGLAYRKNCGDQIDTTRIEKTYILESRDMQSKFQELLENISDEYLELSEEIIRHAKIQLGKKLSDIIYINLTDHIAMSIERCRKGILLKNPLLLEIRRFYPEEYFIGAYAVTLINQKLAVALDENEAAFVALHFVNAQLDSEIPLAYEVTQILQEIQTIVRLRFQLEYDEDSVYYYRFTSHLKFFSQRLLSGEMHQSQTDTKLLDFLKKNYSESYECVEAIKQLLSKKYNYSLTSEEEMYLTIHIEKIVAESRKTEQK